MEGNRERKTTGGNAEDGFSASPDRHTSLPKRPHGRRAEALSDFEDSQGKESSTRDVVRRDPTMPNAASALPLRYPPGDAGLSKLVVS